MLELLQTAAAGLHFLHSEILSSYDGKPPIAHRDIKSKNLLIKAHGQCCIADLGLAVMPQLLDGRTKILVGTRRYMAPELLSQSLNVKCMESFKRVDVYAFSLVMWETAHRCVIRGKKGVNGIGGVNPNHRVPHVLCKTL